LFHIGAHARPIGRLCHLFGPTGLDDRMQINTKTKPAPVGVVCTCHTSQTHDAHYQGPMDDGSNLHVCFSPLTLPSFQIKDIFIVISRLLGRNCTIKKIFPGFWRSFPGGDVKTTTVTCLERKLLGKNKPSYFYHQQMKNCNPR
jgi:hypothetical protein